MNKTIYGYYIVYGEMKEMREYLGFIEYIHGKVVPRVETLSLGVGTEDSGP